MKLNIDKLSAIYDTDNTLKEILNILLKKAFRDGDGGFREIFYGFGFYEFDDDELDDDEEVLNVPLLLNMNKELRYLILNQIKLILEQVDDKRTSIFFNEFMEDSGLFVTLGEYKKLERKLKLKELNKN